MLAALLALVMVLSMAACGGGTQPSATDAPKTEGTKTEDTKTEDTTTGKITVNVWAFTDEVPGMVSKYMEAHPDARTSPIW